MGRDDILLRIGRVIGEPALAAIEALAPRDLSSLLLHLFERRAAEVGPLDALARAGDALFSPSFADPRASVAFLDEAFAATRAFEAAWLLEQLRVWLALLRRARAARPSLRRRDGQRLTYCRDAGVRRRRRARRVVRSLDPARARRRAAAVERPSARARLRRRGARSRGGRAARRRASGGARAHRTVAPGRARLPGASGCSRRESAPIW